MKGMAVLRTLGKRLAQLPVSKPKGGHRAGAHTPHTVTHFSATEKEKLGRKVVLVRQ